jgi:hypothetical protein
MTYAIRNTLFIAAFWAVALAGGFYYIYGHQENVVQKARHDTKVKRQRLQDLLVLERDRSALQSQLTALDDFRQGKIGTIAAEESPGETFDYLLRELSRAKSGLDVNFALKSQDTFLSLERRTYEIKGSGSFRDFYDLLSFLEQGPIFYDVHQLEMSTTDIDLEKGKHGEVSFTLEFNGYNRMEGPPITSIDMVEDTSPQIADMVGGRPARRGEGTRVPESVQPPVEKVQPPKVAVLKNTEGLPEIDGQTKVLAIMPGAAVLKDQKGRTVRLRPGDRVYGGTLNEIDTRQGTLSFSLQDDSGGATSLVLPAGSN